MRIKNYRIISLITAILIFLSGLYFDNNEPNTLLATSSVETANSCITKTATINPCEQGCTPELLGIRSTDSIQQLSNRLIIQKREAKISLDFLYSNFLFTNKGNFFTTLSAIRIFCPKTDELVINYIHESDGKKRI